MDVKKASTKRLCKESVIFREAETIDDDKPLTYHFFEYFLAEPPLAFDPTFPKWPAA